MDGAEGGGQTRCYAATNGFPSAIRRGLLSDLHIRQLLVLPNKLINKTNVFVALKFGKPTFK
jgi:hypothetical protein